MGQRIVFLERASVDARFRAPQAAHEWIEFAETTADQIVPRLEGAHIAIVNKARIGLAELEALPDLKMIALAATGSDNVDLVACRARGITVSNVRGYAVTTVPEHVMALLLAMSRRLFDYTADVAAGRWSRSPNFCFLDYPIRDLRGAMLGIVGSGSLGRGVAELARGFGMQVVFSERPGADTVREGRMAFDELLRQADAISLHCPLTEETRHLINARSLATMKPTALLINTARGALVDEQALADALRAGTIGGAAVDVLSQEPPVTSNPLLAGDVPRLIVTPHVAWASGAAMQALADQVVDNIDAFLAGSPRHTLG
jgi:glycerate dehydrogenase